MPVSKVWLSLGRLSHNWCALYNFSCSTFRWNPANSLAAGIRSRPDGLFLLLSKERHPIAHLVASAVSWSRSQWPRDLRLLACWECGFESQRGHGCLSVVSVVCLQVDVSATSWSLVQRSPTDSGASSCVILKPHEWGGHGPLGVCCAKEEKKEGMKERLSFRSWHKACGCDEKRWRRTDQERGVLLLTAECPFSALHRSKQVTLYCNKEGFVCVWEELEVWIMKTNSCCSFLRPSVYVRRKTKQSKKTPCGDFWTQAIVSSENLDDARWAFAENAGRQGCDAGLVNLCKLWS
jgi:hypothetical protein